MSGAVKTYAKIYFATAADGWVRHLSKDQFENGRLFAALEDPDGNLCLVPPRRPILWSAESTAIRRTYRKIYIATVADEWVGRIPPERIDHAKLLLGMEDDDGNLCLVGFARSLKEAMEGELRLQ
jgi:hypothetical protein